MVRSQGRLRYLRLSTAAQVAMTFLMMVTAGWFAFSSASYVLHGRILAGKEDLIAKARLSYRSSIGELAEYERRFADTARTLEDFNGTIVDLKNRKAGLEREVAQLRRELRLTRNDRAQYVAAGENLRNELKQTEDHVQGLSRKNETLKSTLSSVKAELETAVAERNLALFQRDRMNRQVGDLEARLVDLQDAERDIVQRLSEKTVESVEDFESVIAHIGIKPEDLIDADDSLTRSQGGPFVKLSDAPDVSGDGPAEIMRQQLTSLDTQLQYWSHLQGILEKLPLTAPMPSFQITSRYGKRRDPLSGKWAMHYGLDMGGVFKQAVFATAPGVVTYSGWKGNYGRMVEIDHGAGVKTRFGHLAKALVKKGQKVEFYDKIGLMGNSGRSTGAHLHYEVLFKNRPRDPMKFIKAGRYVFKG